MSYQVEKHLEFISNIITRMNECSFKIKEWTVTLVSGLLVLYVTIENESNGIVNKNNIILYIALMVIAIFWVLDTYYLVLEKKYRDMYEVVAKSKSTRKSTYIMPLEDYKRDFCFRVSVMFSKSERRVYLTLLICVLGALLFIK